MSKFESAEFKQLQAEWDKKLKATGFIDAEETVKGERVLRQNAANTFRQSEAVQREAKSDYYSQMSAAIHQHWFETEAEERLINRIAEGEKLGAVANDLGIHRQTARYMVRRFENRYLIRKWTLEEMNLTKPEDSYSIVRFESGRLPEQYLNMIRSQFLRSLRHGNDYFKLMDSEAYYKKYGAYVNSILQRPDMVVSIAALTDDKDVVLAWSLSEGSTLHYVFCKPDYRRHRIATSLLPKDIETVTHLTAAGATMWNKQFPKAKFDPFN